MSSSPRPPRMRDRLRELFGRPPTPSLTQPPTTAPAQALPIRTAPAQKISTQTASSQTTFPQVPSVQKAVPSPAKQRAASKILADALEALDQEDRETVRSLLPTNATGIDAAFGQAHSCATELQRQYATRRSSWEYRGRRIHRSDQVDKVLQLLDKFKFVGDAISNVDPVHIGLPWAGIRVIIEVCYHLVMKWSC